MNLGGATGGEVIDFAHTVQMRVHEKFGIGHIDEIKEIGSSKMYVIYFGKQGKKAVDALYANLKKF